MTLTTLLQLVCISYLRRYKLFALPNPCSVIFNKCDVRFGDINWIKRKTMRKAINEETSHSNLGKSWKVSQTCFSTESTRVYKSFHSNRCWRVIWTIWTKGAMWFISFHKGIHHSVLQVLTIFQQRDAVQLNIKNARGVFAPLIHEIGHMFRIIMARPLFKWSYSFSMGLQHTSSICTSYMENITLNFVSC